MPRLSLGENIYSLRQYEKIIMDGEKRLQECFWGVSSLCGLDWTESLGRWTRLKMGKAEGFAWWGLAGDGVRVRMKGRNQLARAGRLVSKGAIPGNAGFLCGRECVVLPDQQLGKRMFVYAFSPFWGEGLRRFGRRSSARRRPRCPSDRPRQPLLRSPGLGDDVV